MSKYRAKSDERWRFNEGDRERRMQSVVYRTKRMIDAGTFDPESDHLIGYVVCEWNNDDTRADDIANARLIAASPQLLEVLEAINKFFENGSEVFPSGLFDESMTFREATAAAIKAATHES